jgi:hypothetical protein
LATPRRRTITTRAASASSSKSTIARMDKFTGD